MGEWAMAAALVIGAPALKEVRKPVDPPAGEWAVEWMAYRDLRPVTPPKVEPHFMRARFTRTSRTVVTGQMRPAVAEATFFRVRETLCVDFYAGDPEHEERGIWKVEGDTLTICWGLPGEPRPTDFTRPKGSNRVLMVLKRVSEE